jgi:hypothetical protein
MPRTSDGPGSGPGWRAALFPWPQRRLPWARPVQVVLRAAHVAAMGVVLGGLAFGVPEARLHVAGLATIASGVLLLAVELARSGVYVYTGAGVLSLLKLVLLGAGQAFPAGRFELYLAATLVAAVGAHMSSRWRHFSLLDGKVLGKD